MRLIEIQQKKNVNKREENEVKLVTSQPETACWRRINHIIKENTGDI